MTLANRLTLTRAFLGIVTFCCLWTRQPFYYAIALVLYILAIITDWVDGYVARMTASVSPFGMIADPIADKILVIGALIAFLRIPGLHIPAWAIFLIVVRDLAIGGLRTLGSGRKKMMAADQSGKWKMGIQSIAVLVIMTLLVLRERMQMQLPLWTNPLPFYLVLFSMIASWVSGISYIRNNLRMLQASWNAPKRAAPPGME